MKDKIIHFDSLTEKWEEANHKYEIASKRLTNREGVSKAEKALRDIKLEVFKLEQRMGVIKAILPEKERGVRVDNHLYDDLEDLGDLGEMGEMSVE